MLRLFWASVCVWSLCFNRWVDVFAIATCCWSHRVGYAGPASGCSKVSFHWESWDDTNGFCTFWVVWIYVPACRWITMFLLEQWLVGGLNPPCSDTFISLFPGVSVVFMPCFFQAFLKGRWMGKMLISNWRYQNRQDMHAVNDPAADTAANFRGREAKCPFLGENMMSQWIYPLVNYGKLT